MIEELAIAEKLNRALLKASSDLDKALAEIWPDLSGDERIACQRAIGRMVGEILLEGLNPLHDRHPSLIPEGMTDFRRT